MSKNLKVVDKEEKTEAYGIICRLPVSNSIQTTIKIKGSQTDDSVSQSAQVCYKCMSSITETHGGGKVPKVVFCPLYMQAMEHICSHSSILLIAVISTPPLSHMFTFINSTHSCNLISPPLSD